MSDNRSPSRSDTKTDPEVYEHHNPEVLPINPEGADSESEYEAETELNPSESTSLDEESEVDDRAPDEIPGAIEIEKFTDSLASKLDDMNLKRIFMKYGIPWDDVRTPGSEDRPHLAPEGYMTVNRLMCWVGAIPPFPPIVIETLKRLGIDPMQLHPNAYAGLYTLYIAYEEILHTELTFKDLKFFYLFKHRSSTTPKFSFFESVANRKVLSDGHSNIGDPKADWFYIQRHAGCSRRWLKSSKL